MAMFLLAACVNAPSDNGGDDSGDVNRLKGTQISTTLLNLNDKNLTLTVSNATEIFSFKDDVKVASQAYYKVTSDEQGEQAIESKIVSLVEGDNTYYVRVINANDVKVYTAVIRRRPMYQVTFVYGNGQDNGTQSVEESFKADRPVSDPERAGYTFDGWDYDFDNAIAAPTTINAKWIAKTDTVYKVEYYFESLNGGYEIDDSLTEQKTGTTDDAASATPKTFEYFTFNDSMSNTSCNIDGDGNGAIKLYYLRNKYTVTLDKGNENGTVSGGGSYANAQEVTATASDIIGHDFDGWYDGELRVSTSLTYKFNPVKDITLTAKWVASTYTISFDFDGNTEIYQPITVVYGQEATLPEMILDEGYVGYWSYNGAQVNSSKWNLVGDITLVAKYKKVDYIVKFDLTSVVRKKDVECSLVSGGDVVVDGDLEQVIIYLTKGECLADVGIEIMPVADPIEPSGWDEYSFSGYWKYVADDNKLHKVYSDTVFNETNFPGVGADKVVTLIPHCRAHWTPSY